MLLHVCCPPAPASPAAAGQTSAHGARHSSCPLLPPLPHCSLDLQGNPLLLDPIPFAATAAGGLRALATYTMGLQGSGCLYGLEDWPALQAKLSFFPHLEVGREGGRAPYTCTPCCAGMPGFSSAAPLSPAHRPPPPSPLPPLPQLLCLEADGADEDTDALLGLIAANYPCKVDVGGRLDEHPVYSGLVAGWGTTAKCG